MTGAGTTTGPRRSAAIWFVSYGLSLLGGGVMSVVLPLLVLERTGDVLAAGVLATVTTAASAATGLVSGLVADRLDRRLVSAACDVLATASVAAIPCRARRADPDRPARDGRGEPARRAGDPRARPAGRCGRAA